jgi:cytochrome P450
MSALAASRRTEDSEALRIFLRLIRPRPLADPYPLYARLRNLAPLLPIRLPGVPAGYLVSTFAGCSRLLRDPAFGPPTGEQLDMMKPGWRDNPFTSYLYRSMVFVAGAAHRERREAASRHFAPAQAARHRAEVDQIAGLLVGRLAGHGGQPAGHGGQPAGHGGQPAGHGRRLAGHGPAGDQPVDLVEHLALPFAALSLGRLLAIGDEEAIELGRLARQAGAAFEQFASAEQHATVARAGEELVQRLAVITASRGPGGNLLAELAAGHVGDDEAEQVGAAVLLFGAGFDSPASMVGLGAKLLLEHPRQARLVADEPAIAAGATAEILRYEPPVQLVVRTALESAELVGQQIPAGSMVFGLIGAANRDPAQVKEPEVFDVTRKKVSSLSFGAGPHYCLGAYLAGMQGEVLFPRLLRAFPGLRLAGPADQPVYRSPGSTLRGLDRLPVYLQATQETPARPVTADSGG